jgi:hypothetical protein
MGVMGAEPAAESDAGCAVPEAGPVDVAFPGPVVPATADGDPVPFGTPEAVTLLAGGAAVLEFGPVVCADAPLRASTRKTVM